MRRHELVYALNAGGVDPEAIARADLQKMRLAGEHAVKNLFPKVLGPATLRPGTESLASIPGNDQTKMVRFVRSIGTSYMLLFSDSEMRVMLNGVIQQVPSVATSIATGSWTDASTSPATATGGATLTLNATTTATARLRQTVTVTAPDQAVSNVLRVVVSAGPVFLRIGTTSGGEELLSDAELDTGTHKIAVTPGAGTIYVQVSSTAPATRSVSSIQFESTLLGGSGDLVIPTPWSFADVEKLRTWQSIDVLYVGDGLKQQRQIEHRGPLSWSIALYKSNSGPLAYGSTRLTMTPAALSGNTTVTASEAYFKAGHVGALLELTQTGKTVTSAFNAIGQTSDYITVIGVQAGRYFYRTGVGSAFVGTIVLERSFDAVSPSAWTTFATYVDGAATFARTVVDDAQTNLTVHYRYRVTAYTSGSATMTLEYEAGVQNALARVTGYTSSTVVNVETLVNFGNTTATRSWRIGEWSDVRGWPRTPVIHDGRLHWFKRDQDYASVPDDYVDFDDSAEGDSAPISRSVGSGGEEGVLWALSLDRLIVGTRAFEGVISASELDEAITPTAYTVRKPSRRGCADIPAVPHDDGLFFVQRSGSRLYEMSIPSGSNRHKSTDLSRLNPAAFDSGVKGMAVQQQPNTRLYCVMADGSAPVVVTYERDDDVIAITTIDVSGGIVEDIETLPEADQDDVYFIVNRSGVRSVERLGKERMQGSPSTCTLLDAHKVLTGSVSSITGATHLAGQTVKVWADGAWRAPVTLDGSGTAALSGTYARVVYGLGFLGEFKSVKLAYAAALGTALGQTKQVRGAGLVLSNSCLDGIRVGPDEFATDPMPDFVNGFERQASDFFAHYDHDIMPINSEWLADARIYFSIDSAYGPATVQAIVLDIETRDGAQASNG